MLKRNDRTYWPWLLLWRAQPKDRFLHEGNFATLQSVQASSESVIEWPHDTSVVLPDKFLISNVLASPASPKIATRTVLALRRDSVHVTVFVRLNTIRLRHNMRG